jgi:hypothetical protein
MGSEFVLQLPRGLRSYENELFTLSYNLELELLTQRFISLSGLSEKSTPIPL